MFERIYMYFLNDPRRLISLGNNLVRTGGFVLLIGVIGHVATAASAVAMSISKQTAVSRTLAEIYPALPTWWVPESIEGSLPAVVLMVIGLSIASLGKRLKNAYF